jgi:hypothetical protein
MVEPDASHYRFIVSTQILSILPGLAARTFQPTTPVCGFHHSAHRAERFPHISVRFAEPGWWF